MSADLGPMPPDHAARDRIVTDLDNSLLVEAGAGAGKTTQLVARMVSLIVSGRATTDQIAAVTFTRKAAAELRERFQAALEGRLRQTAAGSEEHARLSTAVERIEHAFLGTIHAFAARLLRERPLEAGLDPGFQEVLETEAHQDARRFWIGHLERLAADGSEHLEALADVGLRPNELEGAFHHLTENLDVAFPAPEVSLPTREEIRPIRLRLESLIEEAADLLPDAEPGKGWGVTQGRVRTALYTRRRYGWDDPGVFFDALYPFSLASFSFTQNRWTNAPGSVIKDLHDRFKAFSEDESVLALAERWLAHRYTPAIRFLVEAAELFRAERGRLGRLSFQDLLTFTLDLLRGEPRARQNLGRRYRWLLVDEFQDTDPLQAEIMFLLAAEPTEADLEGAVPDWRRAEPRPGALFLVGDPKQSIYRFRRADIAVYNYVRERMSRREALVSLDANFRSLLPIAGIVNDVFSEVFPEDGNRYQAPYASLRPQRAGSAEPTRVMTYTTSYKYGWGAADAERDGERIASWVKARVDAGERDPSDFLILIWRKKHLPAYARALEARRLKIDVSGAGVGFEHDLEELLTLLSALADPDDPTKIVAALGGLFMGLDAEQLASYSLDGGRFSLTRDTDPAADEPVARELHRLARWWDMSRTVPADIFVGRLIDELGLFPHAAGGDLGALRAGALAYMMDVVRATAAAGDTSLIGIAEAIRTGLAWEEAEAPLEPGRADAVRVMNVHKAKGLQAPVVILAGPGGYTFRGRDLHVTRSAGGEATGYLQIQRSEGWTTLPLARPLEWRALAEEEERFGRAEDARLLYVAATRAEDELLVGRVPGRTKSSPWGLLDQWLDRHGMSVEAPQTLVGGAELAGDAVLEIANETEALRAERGRRAAPSYRFDSVSGLAKGKALSLTELGATTAESPAQVMQSIPPTRGYEWGSVVHQALAAATAGLEDDALRGVLASLLREYDRPLLEDGSPKELDELVELVETVRGSELWSRAAAAEQTYAEMPFAVALSDVDQVAQFVEGVIDLVFKEGDAWVVADYKTDVGVDPKFPERKAAYRAQVDLYARSWSTIRGEPVKERILFFTSLGVTERW